jgi:hypothetical protein
MALHFSFRGVPIKPITFPDAGAHFVQTLRLPGVRQTHLLDTAPLRRNVQ